MATKNKNDKQVSVYRLSNGSEGEQMPANAAVLKRNVRECVEVEGKKVYKIVTKWLAIEGVRSTQAKDIVLPVLALMLSDAQQSAGFKSKYQFVTVGSENVKTGIKTGKQYSAWLSGTKLFKTNSKGEESSELELDNGLTLRRTLLNVSVSSPLVTAEGAKLKALMHTTALAICEQATLAKLIVAKAAENYSTAYAADEAAK